MAEGSTKHPNEGALRANAQTISTRLDSMIICSKCHGLGIYKNVYNHHSHDLNCPKCDGEGILSKEFDTGKVKNSNK